MADSANEVSRRQFLARMTIGLSVLAGAVISVPMIGDLLSPLLHPVTNVWRSVGPVAKFEVGQTVHATYQDPSPLPWSGLTAEGAAWIRRNSTAAGDFTAFSVNCAHLGCPVDWLPDANIFMCPCHGGVYYADGAVAAGPPPRGLFRFQTRVVGGNLEILTRPLPIG